SRQTHDEGAPVGQGQSDGAADSRGGTRDHRDPPIEALWRSVPWHGDHHTVIWVRRLRSPPRTRVDGQLADDPLAHGSGGQIEQTACGHLTVLVPGGWRPGVAVALAELDCGDEG